MPFEKGNTHSSGRKPGSKNKISGKLKERLTEIIEDNIEVLEDDLDRMKPVERVQALTTLMSFVMPKMKMVEHEVSGGLEFNKVRIYINDEKEIEND